MNEIKHEHIKNFRSIVKSLDNLMKEICEYNSDANLYVEDAWNFNLMKGPTHEGINENPLYENSVEVINVYKSGGGGW